MPAKKKPLIPPVMISLDQEGTSALEDFQIRLRDKQWVLEAEQTKLNDRIETIRQVRKALIATLKGARAAGFEVDGDI